MSPSQGNFYSLVSMEFANAFRFSGVYCCVGQDLSDYFMWRPSTISEVVWVNQDKSETFASGLVPNYRAFATINPPIGRESLLLWFRSLTFSWKNSIQLWPTLWDLILFWIWHGLNSENVRILVQFSIAVEASIDISHSIFCFMSDILLPFHQHSQCFLICPRQLCRRYICLKYRKPNWGTPDVISFFCEKADSIFT